MLSLVDLVIAQSVSLELAGYLAAVMRSGASLLVCASPGGIGKTTVMAALLNFVPDDVHLVTFGERQPTSAISPQHRCSIAHEIGDGHYFAYVWGATARKFYSQLDIGMLVASNLHVDSMSELYGQLCTENGIPAAQLDKITLKVFIRGTQQSGLFTHRWISHVYENAGDEDRLLWQGNATSEFLRLADSKIFDKDTEELYVKVLRQWRDDQARTMREIRERLVISNSSSALR